MVRAVSGAPTYPSTDANTHKRTPAQHHLGLGGRGRGGGESPEIDADAEAAAIPAITEPPSLRYGTDPGAPDMLL